MNTETIFSDLQMAQLVLKDFMSNEVALRNTQQAAECMVKCLQSGGKIISCGNGGSMSDAMHFAEELTGRYREHRKAIAAISISDPTHLSCTANDYGYDFVFSRYIEAVGNKGDILLAISTSGNSPNVVKAIEAAKAKQMNVVALTGKDGGQIGKLCDIEIRVEHFGYADRIQEIHIKIIHALINSIEQNLI